MKLQIILTDKNLISSYLSILSIGLLSCIEDNRVSLVDAMRILYSPGLIDIFEQDIPDLSKAIHMGTELEDIASIIPNHMDHAVEELKKQNYRCIGFNAVSKQQIFYIFDVDGGDES